MLFFCPLKDLAEAKSILGISGDKIDEKVIKEAHRKLMVLNHPDAGGSTYIAIKLNEAKAILLKDDTSTK